MDGRLAALILFLAGMMVESAEAKAPGGNARCPIDASDVARLPVPGDVVPGAFAFTPDGKALTYLKSESASLDRVLWRVECENGVSPYHAIIYHQPTTQQPSMTPSPLNHPPDTGSSTSRHSACRLRPRSASSSQLSPRSPAAPHLFLPPLLRSPRGPRHRPPSTRHLPVRSAVRLPRRPVLSLHRPPLLPAPPAPRRDTWGAPARLVDRVLSRATSPFRLGLPAGCGPARGRLPRCVFRVVDSAAGPLPGTGLRASHPHHSAAPPLAAAGRGQALAQAARAAGRAKRSRWPGTWQCWPGGCARHPVGGRTGVRHPPRVVRLRRGGIACSRAGLSPSDQPVRQLLETSGTTSWPSPWTGP